MPSSRRKLTKSFVESYPLPNVGYDIVRDTQTPGFGIKFTKKYRTYFVERKVHGKTKRVNVARHGALTLDQARTEAQGIYGDLSKGIDVTKKRKEDAQEGKIAAVQATTLAQCYADFLQTRKNISPKTKRDYDRAILNTLSKWLDVPIIKIKSEMVLKEHTRQAKKAPAQANLTMRTLRAVLNFAIEVYTLPNGEYLINRNPVTILSKTKAWAQITPRQNHIKPHQLPAWFQAVEAEENHTLRDYLKFVLLTGLRREDAASLMWKNVDLEGRSFDVLPKQKKAPISLPLTDYLVAMLNARKEGCTTSHVFPGEGRSNYLAEPKRGLQRIEEETGIKTTIHDLRRSYAKFAASLYIPEYQIKRLMAHSAKGDVTHEHYIQHNLEHLREAAQQITDYVIKIVETA